MRRDDELLLKRFVEKAKKLPELQAIILFGSMARGDEDARSDVDLLLLFKCDRPDIKYSSKVNEIISSLKPHREIMPTLANISQYDKAFVGNVMREGKPLFGSVLVSAKGLALAPFTIISYDLSKAKGGVKQKVVRAVYGYVSKKRVREKIMEYKYKGLKDDEGVVIIAPGALLLPDEKATGFMQFLKRVGVPFNSWRVWK